MQNTHFSSEQGSIKKKWLTVLSVCLFVLFFAIFFQYTYNRLRLKSRTFNTMHGFYQEPENSLDIVFVGSSHMYRAISPMYLWERFGIPSYDVCTPAQGIISSYYVIREVLRYQHPKAIVLDTYGAQYDRAVQNISRIHPITDAMPWKQTKIDMFRNYLVKNYSLDNLKELAFPFLTYHSRWTGLTRTDFQEGRSSTKGCMLSFASQPQEKPPLYGPADTVPEIFLEYLDKIIEQCQKSGVDLILCQIPMGNWKNYQPQREKMSYFMHYGQERGAKALDIPQVIDETGIDYTEDFKDIGHLNTKGAYKLTEYFGEYLREQYQLPDHRGEELYEQWDILLLDYWASYQQKQNTIDEEDEEDSIE